MLRVAIRVAHVVLHVTDQSVVPIGDVQRSVTADFEIAGAKVRIVGGDQRFRFNARDIGSVVLRLELQNS